MGGADNDAQWHAVKGHDAANATGKRNEEALAGLLVLFHDHGALSIENIPGWR